MANAAVQRIHNVSHLAGPLLHEIEKRIEDVQRRAFELFQMRGQMPGHDPDDWIRAEHEVMGWSAAELAETDGEYNIEMSLPGFDARQMDVMATPAHVAVHANCTTEKNAQEERIVWTEFKSTDVYRRFDLPQPINPDQVTATSFWSAENHGSESGASRGDGRGCRRRVNSFRGCGVAKYASPDPDGSVAYYLRGFRK